ncbi:MAG: HlyC/CorC family transporter [Verrucomicrobiae bacterium]|nr:HlyC/CorC family transporter [Verrucomicrobiae bacterium]MCP5541666.1 HlyC/CorC family transporter [Akkermansiaceae bacterium]MCP5549311.1 HlyC/CorC family transporter [Akkermansiaceae bacterium]
MIALRDIPCLAAASAGHELTLNYGELQSGYVGWQVFLLLLFVALNGFFVAAEFALVKVRTSQLEPLVEAKKKSAVLTGHIVHHLDAYLSACQLGITIASIVLGSVSEPFISRLLQPALSLAGLSEGWIRSLSFLVGISAITFLHVVVGEQLPKVLAIRKSLGAAMLCSRPLHAFYLVFRLPIRLLNGCATWLLRTVFRVEPGGEHSAIHSAEELAILVEQTGVAGEVTETEREILINALELNELTVRDIMTPRNEAVMLDVNKSFEENIDLAIESKHTRFPLVEGHLDHTLGLVHIKDLLAEMRRENPDLHRIRRDLAPVPELMPLDSLLQTFLERHAHMALVVDEFGGALGLVMFDDVVEELVGEIQDEFDEDDREFRRVDSNEFVADGTLPLHELAEHADIELGSPDVSTVGGYVTHIIGRLPEIGETAIIEGYEATVTKADERSVQEVRFRRLEPVAEEDENGTPGGEGTA